MESSGEIDSNNAAESLLRNLIRQRLGLSLSDQDGVRLIGNRLAGRVKQNRCESFLEYCHLLSCGGAAAEEEWRQVMAVLATSKSGFFRQRRAVRALVNVALPQLLSRSHTETASPSEPLRIWSASCATGEEPISIAIALDDGGWFDRVPIEIQASDASYVAIERAIQGVYSEEKVSALDVRLRDKYFTREEDGWRVVPRLHDRIHWRIANLMIENEVGELAKSHVVFCRNVFIYFTENAICQTLRLFAQLMPAGAFLFSDSGDYFTRLVTSIEAFDALSSAGSDMWIRRD